MNKLGKISGWILGGMVLCIVFGCLDGKPTVWDIEDDDSWEIWSEGTITSIKAVANPDNTISNDAYEIVFDNGNMILAGQLRNPGIVQIGEVGTLYKHNLGNENSVSWFQWIGDEGVRAEKNAERRKDWTPATKTIGERASARSPEVATAPIEPPVIAYQWVDRVDKNPERYTPVLIKLKNNTMSLGYINNINEWKLSINEKDDKGGKTISNLDIIAWKNVDVE
jgi:hypothetical protein